MLTNDLKRCAMRYFVVVFTIVLLNVGNPADIYGQVITNMTEADIEEAIVIGLNRKDVELYKIQGKARFSWPPVIGYYTTPWLRVALAANNEKKRYQSFGRDDVTPEMLAPSVTVLAPAGRTSEQTSVADVITVIIMPRNSDDRSQAIHPTTSLELTYELKNLFGFTAEGIGMRAMFPISVLSEDNEIHVVFN